ncbi:hypothetical protein RZS08_63005, partial [Arthrospira platensis SPKY1]|nr:hypothetical protein [Arthrospira platensis SPKY1]
PLGSIRPGHRPLQQLFRGAVVHEPGEAVILQQQADLTSPAGPALQRGDEEQGGHGLDQKAVAPGADGAEVTVEILGHRNEHDRHLVQEGVLANGGGEFDTVVI